MSNVDSISTSQELSTFFLASHLAEPLSLSRDFFNPVLVFVFSSAASEGLVCSQGTSEVNSVGIALSSSRKGSPNASVPLPACRVFVELKLG